MSLYSLIRISFHLPAPYASRSNKWSSIVRPQYAVWRVSSPMLPKGLILLTDSGGASYEYVDAAIMPTYRALVTVYFERILVSLHSSETRRILRRCVPAQFHAWNAIRDFIPIKALKDSKDPQKHDDCQITTHYPCSRAPPSSACRPPVQPVPALVQCR